MRELQLQLTIGGRQGRREHGNGGGKLDRVVVGPGVSGTEEVEIGKGILR